MALTCLISSEQWDAPFFKRLANNDTGAASGHQGGIVVPKDLRDFFPGLLEATTSALNPTTDRRLSVELFVENRYLGTANPRYQFQTWGGTRGAESRLTDQLGPLRDLARGDDILVIRRNVERLDQYRLTLVRQTDADFALLLAATNGKRWGVLGQALPMSQSDLEIAVATEGERESAPFVMLDESALVVESTTRKVARSVAFRERVCRLYGHTCVVCSSALKSPSGALELDAAHIVPRSRFGADDARNGIALCKRHHWAFDGGLFGISDALQVLIPRHVAAIPQNASLQALSGQRVRPPVDVAFTPHPDALAWHRQNVLLRE